MRRLLLSLLLTAATLATGQAWGQVHEHGAHHAATVSDTSRAHEGTLLDPAEAAGLLAGQGLGMARPAELNGYPGPLHVLELADELGLSPEQRAEAERLRAAMLAEAKPLGAAIVEGERHLVALFAEGHATAEAVDRITAHLGSLRGKLRAAHLRTHLGMRDALTAEQRARYDELRGYAASSHRH